MTPNKNRKRVFWFNDADDFRKLPAWLAWRIEYVDRAVAIVHPDTEAVSICLFRNGGADEAGIIRCDNQDLADKAIDLLEPHVSVPEQFDHNEERHLYRRAPAPKRKRDFDK